VSELALPIPAEWLDAIAERVAELLNERVPAADGSPYLNIGEAAEYLRCDRQRIYDLRSSGRLTRYGNLVARAELDAFLLPPVARVRSASGLAR
jgi:Helix-turn-helix domain